MESPYSNTLLRPFHHIQRGVSADMERLAITRSHTVVLHFQSLLRILRSTSIPIPRMPQFKFLVPIQQIGVLAGNFFPFHSTEVSTFNHSI